VGSESAANVRSSVSSLYLTIRFSIDAQAALSSGSVKVWAAERDRAHAQMEPGRSRSRERSHCQWGRTIPCSTLVGSAVDPAISLTKRHTRVLAASHMAAGSARHALGTSHVAAIAGKSDPPALNAPREITGHRRGGGCQRGRPDRSHSHYGEDELAHVSLLRARKAQLLRVRQTNAAKFPGFIRPQTGRADHCFRRRRGPPQPPQR
jgi:hypothetical protein